MAKQTEDRPTPPPVARSTSGIRELLFQEVDRLRGGISTPGEANAIARLAQQIQMTVKLEMDVHKYWALVGGETNALPPPSIDLAGASPHPGSAKQ